jgi:hypothetical protein
MWVAAAMSRHCARFIFDAGPGKKASQNLCVTTHLVCRMDYEIVKGSEAKTVEVTIRNSSISWQRVCALGQMEAGFGSYLRPEACRRDS